jgi:membrane-bound hydrogenase subunit alpha
METKAKSPIQINIGPNHPGLKEPVYFSFELEGEKVSKVDFMPGQIHRAIEWMGFRKNPVQIIHTSERICGICSLSHPMAFTRAVEMACGIDVPPRAEFLRVIFAELERIHSHLLWAGVAGMELGFDTVLFKTWEVREKVMDLLERLSGNRVNYGVFQVGGMRRDITPENMEHVLEALEYYEGVFGDLAEIFLEDVVIRARCRHTGVLTGKDAVELLAVGPTLRGSGVPVDLRQDWPYSAYGELDVKAITPDALGGEVVGDVYDRVIVRLLEVKQSVEIIRQALAKMPEGPINAVPKVAVLLNQLKKAEGEGIGRHEAPRGEVLHYYRTSVGNEFPDAWKVKAPTYSNMLSWLKMLQGVQVADIPIVIASIDPCVSCTDRVAIVKDSRTSILTREDLRRLSVEKTLELRKRL